MRQQRVTKPRKSATKADAARKGEREQERTEVREDIRRTWWPEA